MDIPRSSTSPKVLTASITRLHPKSSPLSRGAASGNGDPSARPRQWFGRDAVHLGTRLRSHRHRIDMSQLFTEQAKRRAEKLGVADQVKFIHGDAAGFVSDEKAGVQPVSRHVDRRGVSGTIELLAQSLRREGSSSSRAYWRQLPPTEDVARGVLPAQSPTFSCFRTFSRLSATSATMSWKCSGRQDSWDRYERPVVTMRRWLEDNPDDEFAKDVRAKLTSAPERYAAYTREYMGWGVFALMTR